MKWRLRSEWASLIYHTADCRDFAGAQYGSYVVERETDSYGNPEDSFQVLQTCLLMFQGHCWEEFFISLF